MKKVILASASPRRRSLLKEAGIDFEVVPPTFDELKFNITLDNIEQLALNKAKSIENLIVSALIVGADTIVVNNGKILCKPNNFSEAFNMLKGLSGKEHEVITGIAVVDAETGNYKTSKQITYVTFNQLSDEMIKKYIEEKSPYDKAGAYGIQELPDGFIKSVNGDINNVIGLPVGLVLDILSSF